MTNVNVERIIFSFILMIFDQRCEAADDDSKGTDAEVKG